MDWKNTLCRARWRQSGSAYCIELRNKLLQFIGFFYRFKQRKMPASHLLREGAPCSPNPSAAFLFPPCCRRRRLGRRRRAPDAGRLQSGRAAIFPVASVLVAGQHDAVLIDAQFSRAEAQKLVEQIRASGKA
jgi:hypothetical protein